MTTTRVNGFTIRFQSSTGYIRIFQGSKLASPEKFTGRQEAVQFVKDNL